MPAYNTELFDQYGRTIRPVLFNTAKDGSGDWYSPLLDSDGHLQVDALSAVLAAGIATIGKLAANSGVDIGDVDVLSIAAGANRIGIVLEDPHEVRVSKAIDASLGAYAANDMVNDDDCCTTATCWTFPGMANAAGGYGVIDFATIFNETRNIEPRLTLILFNAVPLLEFTDNTANIHPLPADRAKYVGEIAFPALAKVSASVASVAEASPSTVGKLPLFYKCAAGSTTLYGVLKTLDIFTQVATEDIEIALQVKHL